MKTKLREMVPSDVPKVLELLRQQNERDGTNYPMALVFDSNGRRLPNIPLALVAVDIETGEVRQGHVWERTVEQTCYGIDAEATVCSMHEQDAVFYLLRQRGYSDLHILVPSQSVKEMKHGLERIYGMISTGFQHFYRRLDPAENAALRKIKRRKKQGV